MKLQDLEEGEYVHWTKTGGVHLVESIDVNYDDNNPSGEVVLSSAIENENEDVDDIKVVNAFNADYALRCRSMCVVDEKVLENAEKILQQFALAELSNITNHLAMDRQYSGVESINTLREIYAAGSVLNNGTA